VAKGKERITILPPDQADAESLLRKLIGKAGRGRRISLAMEAYFLD
jgi:hypothetical protein